jgi:small subunit ribosomal protein S3
MIEKEFVAKKTKEYYIRKFVESELKNVGISSIKLKKIPLGEKIIILASRPSIIVGSKGGNIRKLTIQLKEKFNLENPQIEIEEVKNVNLDANIVAEKIVSYLERFGSARFKGVGYKTLVSVMDAGALGVEILISGKIPSTRARRWRFYQGYLKKSGDVSFSQVLKAKKEAILKSGVIGVQVSIMPGNTVLPDSVEILDEPEQVFEEKIFKKPKAEEKQTKAPKKKTVKKATPKKKVEYKKKEEPVKAEPVVEKKEEQVKAEVKEGGQE